MQAIQNLTLDVNDNVKFRYIKGKQWDNNSRFVRITITESGEQFVPPKNCTAVFRCLKQDGTSCINEATINQDNTITVELTNQVLAVEGTVNADISLMDGNSILSSATFFIEVGAVPASANQVTSTDEFLILMETINEATKAIGAIEETVNNAKEALEGVEEIKAYIDNLVIKFRLIHHYLTVCAVISIICIAIIRSYRSVICNIAAFTSAVHSKAVKVCACILAYTKTATKLIIFCIPLMKEFLKRHLIQAIIMMLSQQTPKSTRKLI